MKHFFSLLHNRWPSASVLSLWLTLLVIFPVLSQANHVRYKKFNHYNKKQLNKQDYLKDFRDGDAVVPDAPTALPTFRSTSFPTRLPTNKPTASPFAPTSLPTKSPTFSPTLVPTVLPTSPPTVSPSSSPTLQPTVSPTSVPTSFPTQIPTNYPSALPSISPSGSCPTSSNDVIPFEVSVLIELEGSPGLISESDIATLEDALLDAYNSVAGCDAPGAFITVTNVTIQIDDVDSYGDNIGTGSDAVLDFTWLVLFRGVCRGCPVTTTRALFDGENDANVPTGKCSCAFPLASAYVLECNTLIQQRKPNCPVSFVSATSFIGNGGSTRPGQGNPGSFSSFLTVNGIIGGDIVFSSFQLELIAQAILETYNYLSFFNPQICDTGERVVISVSQIASNIERRRRHRHLQSVSFSIVFEIQGTCAECGSVTLVFGEHQPGPQDETAVCPAGSILRCPTEEEFIDTLNDALDRLEEDTGETLIDVQTVEQSTQPPDSTPTSVPAPVPCTLTPTRAPSPPVPVNVDLTGWSTDDTNGNWVLSNDAQSVTQTINGDPTFFCSDFNSFRNDLAGVIRVNAGGDDDFIGFALGYEGSDDADYLLIDWKRGNQNTNAACGTRVGRLGLAVSRVTGFPDNPVFWAHLEDPECTTGGSVMELARGATLGSVGWSRRVDYSFRFVFTEDRLQVYLNDQLEIDLPATEAGGFTDGAFCFYNFSQGNVIYSGLTRTVITDPPTPSLTCPPEVTPSFAPTTSPESRCKATGWGDPHFVTWDGLKYDCQADGEVILAQSLDSEFLIQGRFTKVGFPTVTTGIAVRAASDLPVVQVSMATRPDAAPTVVGCPVELYVNGVSLSPVDGTGLSSVIVNLSGSRIVVEYPSEDISVVIDVSVFRGVCYFSADYDLGSDCLDGENLVGILGSPNGDANDDWMTRNGTVLSIPSGASAFFFQPAYDYCTSNWCLRTAGESIFTYEAGTSFSDFENCDGIYDESFESAIENAPQCLKDFCEGDTGCIIDGLTLGRGAAGAYLENEIANPTDCTPSEPLTCYFSCSQALTVTCDTLPGLIPICPEGSDGEILSVFCDQETSGGGWMLLYSYKHNAGENNELQASTIPTDPTNGYSHFLLENISGYTVEDIQDVRFFCTTSAHNRTVHFVNENDIVKRMAFDGNQIRNNPSIWSNECNVSELSGHSGIIPAAADNLQGDRIHTDSGGFDNFPFYKGGNNGNHWSIRGLDVARPGVFRWECDNTDLTNAHDTLHNVWVRLAPNPGLRQIIKNQLYNTGVDESGFRLELGSPDPHYTVVETRMPARLTGVISSYYPNNDGSGWIWQNSNNSPTNVDRSFETSFDLSGYDPASAVISGYWMADNLGLDILMNGNSTGIEYNPISSVTQYPFGPAFFTISSGFVPGINNLTFQINDFGGLAAFRTDYLELLAAPL